MLKKTRKKSTDWQQYKDFVEEEIRKTYKGTEKLQIYAIRWIALQTFDKYELKEKLN